MHAGISRPALGTSHWNPRLSLVLCSYSSDSPSVLFVFDPLISIMLSPCPFPCPCSLACSRPNYSRWFGCAHVPAPAPPLLLARAHTHVRIRRLVAARGMREQVNVEAQSAGSRVTAVLPAPLALTRPRLGRRTQARALIAGLEHTWQVKAGMRRQIVCCAGRASTRPRLGRRK